ncbi:uncharacterized protein JN550_002075 [Neoarthrinium moseri]|uniref:uncharacterized protein n=1 Tax=Neoarthrinium moseri TaxID=1658444 RepID=UPI001FDE3DC7|nr:uncharacterized protein JN550_002075 [Neoarthrinium moseri]KAI1875789.1 hypothetical protein JN550_002075 [Neoarthrinium moseri]
MASSSSTEFAQVKKEYDEQAPSYNALLKLPFGVLESQLFISAAAGDGFCKNASVLDLGGGTGLRARQVLEAGAARESGRLRWFHGDVSRPLFGEQGVVGLCPPYDLVMANWIFDHIDSPDVLKALWRNIAAAVRPGGRFVGVRACDPRCEAMKTGKYGPTCQDFVEFSGGIYYSSTIPVSGAPSVHLENASLEVSYSGSTEMHERYGFCDVKSEPCENAEIVKSDPGFWQLWIERPGFVVVKAQKRLNRQQ